MWSVHARQGGGGREGGGERDEIEQRPVMSPNQPTNVRTKPKPTNVQRRKVGGGGRELVGEP